MHEVRPCWSDKLEQESAGNSMCCDSYCISTFYIYPLNFGKKKDKGLNIFLNLCISSSKMKDSCCFAIIERKQGFRLSFFSYFNYFTTYLDFSRLKWMKAAITFHLRPHLLKWNIYVKKKKKQDAEGIQNMSGVSLIGLIFIKWKQL